MTNEELEFKRMLSQQLGEMNLQDIPVSLVNPKNSFDILLTETREIE